MNTKITKTEFFATRTLARAYAKEVQGKVQDFGTDSESGKRWGVMVEVEEVQEVIKTESTSISESTLQTLLDADDQKNLSGSIIGEQLLQSPRKRNVQVLWRRNMEIIRLQAHINKTA